MQPNRCITKIIRPSDYTVNIIQSSLSSKYGSCNNCHLLFGTNKLQMAVTEFHLLCAYFPNEGQGSSA